MYLNVSDMHEIADKAELYLNYIYVLNVSDMHEIEESYLIG
jgi:hypothetical protein